jgi:sialidase-1
MLNWIRLALVCVAVVAVCNAATTAIADSPFHETSVWTRGEDGIPVHFVYALTITPQQTLLAFAEARLTPRDDSPHHLVLKRSTDLGATWSEDAVIERADGSFWQSHGIEDRLECWTNPAALTERRSGRVYFFYALNEGIVRAEHNTQRYTRNFYRFSDDEGVTWSDRVEITHLLTATAGGQPNLLPNGDWQRDAAGFPCDFMGRTFFMPGPGHGLQLQDGRLIMQFWCRTAIGTLEGQETPMKDRHYGIRLLYSDDGGSTWQTGPAIGHELNATESRLVQFQDGEVYLNARTSNGPRGQRGVMLGTADGMKWQVKGYDEAMPRYTSVDSGLTLVRHEGQEVLLLSHPRNETRRMELTISASVDRGLTWPVHRLVHEDGSNYSVMVPLPDGKAGILYARGPSAREGFDVKFLRVDTAAILGNK